MIKQAMIGKRNSLVEAFKPPVVVVVGAVVDTRMLGMVVEVERSPMDPS